MRYLPEGLALAVLFSVAGAMAPAQAGSAIVAGGTHACALTSDGGVKCWGENGLGQLGDGTNTPRNTAGFVRGLRSGVVALAAHLHHTCALTDLGGVKCWGHNVEGQLGDGTKSNRNKPAFVKGLRSGVIDVAAGGFHSCAVLETGRAKCWGDNLRGQLGDGTNIDRLTPVFVKKLSGVAIIDAGYRHTCAVTAAGRAKCWGNNHYGQLGDGNHLIEFQPTPVNVLGLTSGVTAITGGADSTCAQINDGSAKCWGWNNSGKLGDGTTEDRREPVLVKQFQNGGPGISTTFLHTCALTSNGGVRCWGSNGQGQLGDGTTDDRHIRVAVTGLGGVVTAIAAGNTHSCAKLENGRAKCWGDNFFGQLGDGTNIDRLTPVKVIRLN